MIKTIPALALALALSACTTTTPDSDDTGDSGAITDTFPDETGPTTDDTDVETGDTDFLPETDETSIEPIDTDTDSLKCPLNWTRDCNSECYPTASQGDGFCDDGPTPKVDWNCLDFNFDEGDCFLDTSIDTDPNACPLPGDLRDCNGTCFSQLLLGDGTCDDGPAPRADFSCADFAFDDGDCGSDTGPVADTDLILFPCPSAQDVRDCKGDCYPEAWLADGTCDDGGTFVYGDPDFDCAYLAFDRGDCIVDTDTDGVDTGDSGFDTDTDGVDTGDSGDSGTIALP